VTEYIPPEVGSTIEYRTAVPAAPASLVAGIVTMAVSAVTAWAGYQVAMAMAEGR